MSINSLPKVDLMLDNDSQLSSSHVLVAYEDTWGDEIRVRLSAVCSRTNWCRTLKAVCAYFDKVPGAVLINSVGSNQHIEYKSFKDWVSKYKVYTLPFSSEGIALLKHSLETTTNFYWPEWDAYDGEEDDECPPFSE